MFISKGEEARNSDCEHTMSRIQKAGGEDGMFSRQFIEYSIQNDGLMWEINRMKDWKDRLWSDKFGPYILG